MRATCPDLASGLLRIDARHLLDSVVPPHAELGLMCGREAVTAGQTGSVMRLFRSTAMIGAAACTATTVMEGVTTRPRLRKCQCVERPAEWMMFCSSEAIRTACSCRICFVSITIPPRTMSSQLHNSSNSLTGSAKASSCMLGC